MFEKIEFLFGYLKSMPIEKRYNSMGLENFSQTIEYYAGKKMLDADTLGKELQQKILDDDAMFFVSHLNMGIVTKSDVTGIAAHPCDYYEITAELDVE